MDPKIEETQPNPNKPGTRIPIRKTREIINKLPAQKPHIEFISALLTIPVLITVIMLNLNSLRAKPAVTPTPTVTPPSSTADNQKITQAAATQKNPFVTSVAMTGTAQPTADPNQCTKGIGPIDVSFPSEGQTISDNPVCVNISYSADTYCAVVWAYKLDNGPLSDYANNSVCYNNLSSGNHTFTLQVQSLVSNASKTIDRHFTYQSNTQPTLQPSLTPTNAASTSAH